jgi:predicted dehydrogenase
MRQLNRRKFLARSGMAFAGGTALALGAPSRRQRGAGDRVVLGILGCSRGRYLAREFARHNVAVAYICDPDEERLGEGKRDARADHGVSDMRRIFDDASVDAVVVATPDHWHVPAAILACKAGKHVYVEKPCSHNIREGRLLVETARRTRRVVAVGTQSRSTTVLKNGIDRLRRGAIGEILIAKAWNSQRRKNIGHMKPSEPPAGLHYDLWIGPAPMRPFQANCHHYSWHWWYDFGTGDAGNDGVHEIDVALWGLGAAGHPTRASGHATKMFFDDDQEFPDTLYVTFEYPGDGSIGGKKLLVYEQRIWSPYKQEAVDNGNMFYGTKGYLLLSKRFGWKLYGEGGKLLEEEDGPCEIHEHLANFLDAILSGRAPSADSETGHRSATLAHLANILGRTGRGSVAFDPQREEITGDRAANAFVTRAYRENHWAVPRGV